MDRYPSQPATWYLEKVIWEVGEERIAAKRKNTAVTPLPIEPLPIEPTYRLVRHFNGNREAAKRLLRSTQQKYPDKSEQWVLDKVEWDLQRDREV